MPRPLYTRRLRVTPRPYTYQAPPVFVLVTNRSGLVPDPWGKSWVKDKMMCSTSREGFFCSTKRTFPGVGTISPGFPTVDNRKGDSAGHLPTLGWVHLFYQAIM